MAEYIIEARASLRMAMEAAQDAAADLRYTVEALDVDDLKIQKGSLLMSFLFGVIVDYCDFRLRIDEGREPGTIELSLAYNKPATHGLLFRNRNKELAGKLVDVISEYIEEAGGEVLNVEDD